MADAKSKFEELKERAKAAVDPDKVAAAKEKGRGALAKAKEKSGPALEKAKDASEGAFGKAKEASGGALEKAKGLLKRGDD